MLLSTTYPDVDPFDWSTVRPHVDALLAAEWTPDEVPTWLQRWSDLAALMLEADAQVYRQITENTADEAAEQRYRLLEEEIKPRFKLAEQALKQKLLAVDGYQAEADLQILMRRFRTEARIFHPDNVPIETRLALLGNEYNKIVGAMTIEWEGRTETIPQAMSHLEEPDRAVRERAWRHIMDRYESERQRLNELFLEMLPLRRRLAQNAGFADYRAFRWQQLSRFDYTPADCATFHDAIEQEVVPLAAEIYREQAQLLGIDSVRPWDVDVDPHGEPLRPFADVAELETVTQRIFDQVDPALASHYATMRDGYLDLASRPNKALGGYCSGFPVSRKPYIFMNAVGIHQDVATLLHEGGHAFHFMESTRQPLIWNQDGPMEFCEVASMSMELLATPYLTRNHGGFYSEADARRARATDLRGIVRFLPYMAVVDAFQHWVYAEAPEAVTASDLDAAWCDLWDRFMPDVDYSGLQAQKESGWHRKGHIFEVPFYYVEYGLAQLGALQVWRNALGDQARAVADYRSALGLGYSRSLPQLFRAAGATFAFDAGTVGALMNLIRNQLAALRG